MGKSDRCALQKAKNTNTVVLSKDISERKHVEALRESTTQMHPLKDAVEGNITYVDYEKLYGTSPETILGKHVQELMGASDYQKVQGYVEAVLSGEKVTYELTRTCQDGKERYLVIDYVPDISEAGEVLGFFVICQDLTKRTEQVLRQQAERERLVATMQARITKLERQVQERTAQLQQALNFEVILKRVTDKVRDSLDEGQILQTAVQELAQGLSINHCDTALYNPDQTTATICYEYTTSSPPSFQGCVVQMADFPEVFDQLLQGQCFQFYEIGSNHIWHQGTTLVCPIFDDQGILGNLWLLKHKDDAFNELEIRLVQQVANQCAISIRQAQLNRAVQAQVEELVKLNQLKDDFLSTVSHELRTPMVNIKMAIFMLTVAFSQDSSLAHQSRVHRYLQILQDESVREINLINDLLDLQRLETGKQTLILEKIHLQTWLLEVIEPFQEQFRNRQQTLQLNIPSTLPHLVSDLSSLRRILAELLNNACKYTPPGEQITVTAEATPGLIQLKVMNSGTEIPNCELPRIFNKFYRIPSTDPWKQGGTGLGLALVQKLIENLGVTIKVESASNQTCFTLELPLKVSNTTA
jgi:PAS domain S-box-containing protein